MIRMAHLRKNTTWTPKKESYFVSPCKNSNKVLFFVCVFVIQQIIPYAAEFNGWQRAYLKLQGTSFAICIITVGWKSND